MQIVTEITLNRPSAGDVGQFGKGLCVRFYDFERTNMCIRLKMA